MGSLTLAVGFSRWGGTAGSGGLRREEGRGVLLAPAFSHDVPASISVSEFPPKLVPDRRMNSPTCAPMID